MEGGIESWLAGQLAEIGHQVRLVHRVLIGFLTIARFNAGFCLCRKSDHPTVASSSGSQQFHAHQVRS
jgi:hypothetical protein